jgi:hypothetical protein
MSLDRFLVQARRPDAMMPSPHADDQHRRKREEAARPSQRSARCMSAMMAWF